MIIICHYKGKKLVSITRNSEELTAFSGDLTKVFWRLCEDFPDELIIWKEKSVEVNIADVSAIFPHSLIMVSYPATNFFIGDELGYVDQLPFVNPDREVRYPTWRMSTDVGGVYGKVALQFKHVFEDIRCFGYLLNSIAKTGQQNSLFCYSDPAFIQGLQNENSLEPRNTSVLFNFVGQHYKKARLLILFFCFLKYEKRFPLFSFLKALFRPSFFRLSIELPGHQFSELVNISNSEKIDVIIPTLGRPEYLKNVLIDLKNQQKKPEKVIIVEQNPAPNSNSELMYLTNEEWPFRIIHHFTHQTGACKARNIALKEVSSDCVFFADDDIRFKEDLLAEALSKMQKLNIDALNLNTLQPGEKTEFSKLKQWGAFASGASIVETIFAKKVNFSLAFEHGFGEDYDYGMKLRNLGCDIIYHPDLILQHLKAPTGGFRNISNDVEPSRELKPKPSPTFMLLVKRHYNTCMIRGYKVNLFMKFYNKQTIKNPFKYLLVMRNRWAISENKCADLERQFEGKSN